MTAARLCATISAMSRTTPARVATLLVAATLVVWTMAPLCGNKTDSDAGTCCEREALGDQTTGKSRALNISDCCNISGHPAAQLVSIATASAPSDAAAHGIEPPASALSAAEAVGFLGARLEATGPPLYLLTHNY